MPFLIRNVGHQPTKSLYDLDGNRWGYQPADEVKPCNTNTQKRYCVQSQPSCSFTGTPCSKVFPGKIAVGTTVLPYATKRVILVPQN
jgi:hypothetical protein